MMTPAQTAKKDTTKQQAPASAPAAPATPAPAAVAGTPSKQDAVLALLKTSWQKRGIDVDKVQVSFDGKMMNVVVGPDWPLIQLGVNGGVVLPQIRSYPNAFQAAVEGDVLWKKQQERDAKKAAASAPAPAPAKPAAQPSEPKEKTAAQRKQKRDVEIEKQLEQKVG